MHKTGLKRIKHILTGVALALPFLYLAFIVSDRLGVWDRCAGLDLVERASDTFELSYAPGASHPVKIGDPAWQPILKLVYRYSRAKFDASKTPHVLARMQASLSTRTPDQGEVISEWTAPSTPLVLIYQDWPTNTGSTISPDQFRFVGTIEDLRNWISKEKERRKFIVQDIFLGTFGPILGILIFSLERKIDT